MTPKVGKTYRTKDGGQVRVVCTDAKHHTLSVVGLYSHPVKVEREVVLTYTAKGEFPGAPNLDLLPNTMTVALKRWINRDEQGQWDALLYTSEPEAAKWANNGHTPVKATVTIEIEEED